jgi:hypothetical protein
MKKSRQEYEDEPEFIILDERARVFAGLREGYPFFSEDLDEAKPLQGQAKFDFLQRYHHLKLEQMFLDTKPNVRKKRCNNKVRIPV